MKPTDYTIRSTLRTQAHTPQHYYIATCDEFPALSATHRNESQARSLLLTQIREMLEVGRHLKAHIPAPGEAPCF